MIAITPFETHYFQGLDQLWREAFPDDAERNTAAVAVAEKLRYQPDLLLLALDKDQVVGSVMAGYDGHRGWLSRVAVRRTHRGQGLGRDLIAEAERRLAALGCIKINLQVITSNAGVVPFYERLGYRVEERVSMGKLVPQRP